jgi:hypothetical protein
MSMTTQQINALKRLEREGDPNSVHNQKFRQACQEVAEYIVELARPFGPGLVMFNPFRGHTYECWGGYPSPRTPLHLFVEFGNDAAAQGDIVANADIELLRVFAADVAAGLVGAIEEEIARGSGVGIAQCGCNFSDAWRCARDRNLATITCPCPCHSTVGRRHG